MRDRLELSPGRKGRARRRKGENPRLETVLSHPRGSVERFETWGALDKRVWGLSLPFQRTPWPKEPKKGEGAKGERPSGKAGGDAFSKPPCFPLSSLRLSKGEKTLLPLSLHAPPQRRFLPNSPAPKRAPPGLPVWPPLALLVLPTPLLPPGAGISRAPCVWV